MLVRKSKVSDYQSQVARKVQEAPGYHCIQVVPWEVELYLHLLPKIPKKIIVYMVVLSLVLSCNRET